MRNQALIPPKLDSKEQDDDDEDKQDDIHMNERVICKV